MTAERVELLETDASAGRALLEPFNEQTGFDVADGSRTLYALRTTPDGTAAGSAVLGGGELDLFVREELRAQGIGAAAAAQLLERAGERGLTAWSHGDHPAARALATRFGFAVTRTLLKLSLDPIPAHEAPAFDAFRPGADEADWLALNARVFAWHPEQGGTTADDLRERMSEPWFDPSDFLIARDDAGAMIGYNWLKIDADAAPGEGEIYVVGVAPEASGRGLGRALMLAGLARLRARGCTVATLYCEADNVPAVRLYRALGFVDAMVDVQYSRPA